MSAEPAGSPTGTATILFTDLVGSTALRARLGEERAEAETLGMARELVRFERLTARLANAATA
jgi:class 3 adenylate cyclase